MMNRIPSAPTCPGCEVEGPLELVPAEVGIHDPAPECEGVIASRERLETEGPLILDKLRGAHNGVTGRRDARFGQTTVFTKSKENMTDFYILDGKTPKKVDLLTWARWHEDGQHGFVASTRRGNVRVSTVFRGIDRFPDDYPPLLFETTIFGSVDGVLSQYCKRYSTWDEAIEGHQRACRLAGIGTSGLRIRHIEAREI